MKGRNIILLYHFLYEIERAIQQQFVKQNCKKFVKTTLLCERNFNRKKIVKVSIRMKVNFTKFFSMSCFLAPKDPVFY